MEGCTQFKAMADDLRLTHSDQRSDNFNLPLFRACLDDLIERLIIRRTAIRIPRTVLLDCANVDFFRPQNLRPAHCYSQKMRVAERDVSDGDILPNRVRFRHRDFVIRQSRSTDNPQSPYVISYA